MTALRAALLAIGLALAGLPLAAEDAPRVSDAAGLRAAVAGQNGPLELALAPGDYGAVTLRDIADLKLSAPEGGAIFDSIEIINARDVTLDGLTIRNVSGQAPSGRLLQIAGASAGITIRGLDIAGREGALEYFGIHAKRARNITVTGNKVRNVLNGIALFDVTRGEVTGNDIDHIGGDAFKFSNADGLLVADNAGPEHWYPVGDVHEDFMQFQGSLHKDVSLRGNVLLAGTNDSAQGIFFSRKAAAENLLIEQNVIVVGNLRGISVSQGSDIVIQDNTVLSTDRTGRGVARILAPDDAVVRRNITMDNRPPAGGQARSGWYGKQNLAVQFLYELAPGYADRVFRGGPGLDGLRQNAESPAAGIGAAKRLSQPAGLPPARGLTKER